MHGASNNLKEDVACMEGIVARYCRDLLRGSIAANRAKLEVRLDLPGCLQEGCQAVPDDSCCAAAVHEKRHRNPIHVPIHHNDGGQQKLHNMYSFDG